MKNSLIHQFAAKRLRRSAVVATLVAVVLAIVSSPLSLAQTYMENSRQPGEVVLATSPGYAMDDYGPTMAETLLFTFTTVHTTFPLPSDAQPGFPTVVWPKREKPNHVEPLY
jgi:hypothetical protein